MAANVYCSSAPTLVVQAIDLRRILAQTCQAMNPLRANIAAYVATAFPALVFAGPYDGVYKQTANAECALVGVDGGSLRIADNTFFGVSVQCRMTSPVDINDMDATIYTMQCSGDGETWTERAVLMNDAAKTGIYMIWDGYAFRYDRCKEGEY